jgi:hypothetical protein
MSFTTFGIICLILFLVLGTGSSFMKTSKKQYREWWAQQRPHMPLPDKYKYDPNDPDDDKPKMGSFGKFIIGVLISIAVIFVLIILAVVFDLGKYLETKSPSEDKKSVIAYQYKVSDINNGIINVKFSIRYTWSSEKEERYKDNLQLEEYIKDFFKTKNSNYAYDRRGGYYQNDKVKQDWGEPILQYIKELFSDENIEYTYNGFSAMVGY